MVCLTGSTTNLPNWRAALPGCWRCFTHTRIIIVFVTGTCGQAWGRQLSIRLSNSYDPLVMKEQLSHLCVSLCHFADTALLHPVVIHLVSPESQDVMSQYQRIVTALVHYRESLLSGMRAMITAVFVEIWNQLLCDAGVTHLSKEFIKSDIMSSIENHIIQPQLTVSQVLSPHPLLPPPTQLPAAEPWTTC